MKVLSSMAALMLLLMACTLQASDYQDSRTFTAGEAIASPNLLVTLSAGKVVKAGATDEPIGFNLTSCTANALVVVKLIHVGDVVTLTSSASVSVGDEIYPAASGAVSSTVSGRRIGIALTATTGASQTFEVLRMSPTEARGLLPTSVFLSTEQTGNGSSQNIAHGLGTVPRVVIAIPSTLSGGAYVVTYGTHTTTNAVATVTNGEKYQVLCIK